MGTTCRYVWPGRHRAPALFAMLAAIMPPGTPPAHAQGSTAPLARVGRDAAPQVRLVPQQSDGNSAAAWTRDDRFIATVHDLSRVVLVWDAASGNVVNRIEYPAFDALAEIEVQGASVDAANRLTIRGNIREAGSEACSALTMAIPLGQAGEWTVTSGTRGSSCRPRPAARPVIKSHDGRLRLNNRAYPPQIEDRSGARVRLLDQPERTMPFAAALSPDGRRMAMITVGDEDNLTADGTWQSAVTVFDLLASRISAHYLVAGYYTGLGWLDDGRLFLPAGNAATGADEAGTARSPSRIVRATDGAGIGPAAPFRCHTLALPDGTLIGAGADNCTEPRTTGQGLERFDPARGWQPFGPAMPAGSTIDTLALSPDKRRVVSVAKSPRRSGGKAELTFHAIDSFTGAAIAQVRMLADWDYAQIDFAPDGSALGIRVDYRNYRWSMKQDPPDFVPETAMPTALLAGQTVSADGAGWYEQTADGTNAPISAVRIVGGRREARRLFDNVLAQGPIPGSPLRWAVTSLDGIVLWRPLPADPFADPVFLRTAIIDAGHFLSLAPDGRYDTNLAADSDHIRWLVSDAPLQSLGPQTFMRNFFEPGLGPQLLACVPDASCAQTLRPITAVAQLNRVLPQVRIARMLAGPTPDVAIVEVEVRSGRLPDAPNGRTASDGYDLRLFRDGSLVAQSPGAEPDAPDIDIARWRRENRVVPDADGLARVRFPVRLPSRAGPVAFTAYAFNEDRVKSETATLAYTPPPRAAVPGRVFVIALGVDAYAEPRLKLDFAAGDARLIGERLAAIPDSAATRLLVLADDGRPSSARVTRAAIADVFGILGGQPRAPALARLAAQGIDAAMLDAAGPDDAVVISFSGHGWADRQGNFYLLPSEARWPDAAVTPDLASLVSTADMARSLRRIDAGEMALIIDACHSAASVAAKGFRAGPMGDPGLGQLAFDKHMRILAATQADDIALESARLGQGLLTFALASEGVTASGGLADDNGDGAILLDEWLKYATRRLPALSREVRSGSAGVGRAGARGVVFLDGAEARTRVQEPALFDFTGTSSRLVLRRLRP